MIVYWTVQLETKRPTLRLGLITSLYNCTMKEYLNIYSVIPMLPYSVPTIIISLLGGFLTRWISYLPQDVIQSLVGKEMLKRFAEVVDTCE